MMRAARAMVINLWWKADNMKLIKVLGGRQTFVLQEIGKCACNGLPRVTFYLVWKQVNHL
jgi:hypothetical protein